MTLKAEILRLEQNVTWFRDQTNEAQRKINNAAGVIRDYISENGEVTDELRDIANYLGVELTKEIAGTAIYEITFTARVPLDFDPSDLEVTFDVDCNSYEAEDFDWNEDNCEVNAEEV
jgi:hypothetical protein